MGEWTDPHKCHLYVIPSLKKAIHAWCPPSMYCTCRVPHTQHPPSTVLAEPHVPFNILAESHTPGTHPPPVPHARYPPSTSPTCPVPTPHQSHTPGTHPPPYLLSLTSVISMCIMTSQLNRVHIGFCGKHRHVYMNNTDKMANRHGIYRLSKQYTS